MESRALEKVNFEGIVDFRDNRYRPVSKTHYFLYCKITIGNHQVPHDGDDVGSFIDY